MYLFQIFLSLVYENVCIKISSSNEIRYCDHSLQAIGNIDNVDSNVHVVTLKNCGLLQSIFLKLLNNILQRLFRRTSANICLRTKS